MLAKIAELKVQVNGFNSTRCIFSEKKKKKKKKGYLKVESSRDR